MPPPLPAFVVVAVGVGVTVDCDPGLGGITLSVIVMVPLLALAGGVPAALACADHVMVAI